MVKEGDFAEALKDGFSVQGEPIQSTGDFLLDEMLWAFANADERPIAELPPYERRRVRKLMERVSRLKQERKRKRQSR
jgi:hypothetical protein